jgi:hypothetical protein
MAIRRKVVVPVDTLLAIIKDYTRSTHDIPDDAVPVSLQIKPSEKGMFGLMIQSENFKDDAPIRVNFDIKRVYTA